jgi:hypothetical protein
MRQKMQGGLSVISHQLSVVGFQSPVLNAVLEKDGVHERQGQPATATRGLSKLTTEKLKTDN